MVLRGQ